MTCARGKERKAAAELAERMDEVRHGMIGQQSETDQAATAINEMSPLCDDQG